MVRGERARGDLWGELDQDAEFARSFDEMLAARTDEWAGHPGDCGSVPVDVDTRTVSQKRVTYGGPDDNDGPDGTDIFLYEGCTYSSDVGLYFVEGVFIGRAPSAQPSEAECQSAARSGGTDEPLPPGQYVEDNVFCIITAEGKTALLKVKSVEGRTTDDPLPAVTFDVKLWG